VQIRRINLVGAADLPYTSATRLVHDSPSYPVCLDKVAEMIDYAAVRAEQSRLREQGRLVGLGFAVYNELTGLGQAASAGPRMPFRTGHEGATVRMDPSGAVTVLAGVTSQGQGLETTVAQLAAAELGVPIETVTVVLGDTDATPFGLGAFASRQAVIGGGAVVRAASAVRDKIVRVAAHLLEASADDLHVGDGRVSVKGAPGRAVTIGDVARVALLETHRLPPETEPGLDATRYYDPIRGTFAAGAQAAMVEVDRATGAIAIRRFVCVEDTGRIINPLIVEGQVHGGLAQGIAQALFEEAVHDESGTLVTGSFVEYLVPSPADLPAFVTARTETPATTNQLGVKGVGEAGTIASTPAVVNAIVDAVRHLGVSDIPMPCSPYRVWKALQEGAQS
jgi:carbon-monoxide dehydrogenase large subunit